MNGTTFLAMREIPLRMLRPDPENVRDDLGDLDELGRSIIEQGLLQPLLVQQQVGERVFKVIDGHRRYAAAARVGVRSLTCLISARKTGQQTTLAMLAAAMHKQLSPVEQATAFVRLVEVEHMSVAMIAQATGYSQATVRARMSLSDLPDEAKSMVESKTMTLAAATDLARQVRQRRTGTVTPAAAPSPFRAGHPLAHVVSEMCDHTGQRVQVGGVGCGQCWEEAIRTDERASFVVDEQAVERALRGDREVALNPAERHQAILALLARGLSASEAGLVLGVTARSVERTKDRQRRSVAAQAS